MSYRNARRKMYGVRTSAYGRSFKRGIRSRYARRGAYRVGAGNFGYSSTSRGRVRSRTYAALNARTGGLLGIEKKFLDIPMTPRALVAPTDAAGAELPPTSVVTGCYSAPAQGDGPTNRDGNRIVVVECSAKGTINVNAQVDQTAADTVCYVYLAMVQDMQTNGVQLNSEDVFTNPAASAVTAANPFRNMSYTRRFKLLAYKVCKLPIPTLTYDGTNIEQTGFNYPVNLKWKGKMPVTFTTASTTADIANVTDNSIQIVGFCNNTSLAPVVLWNVRTRFYG